MNALVWVTEWEMACCGTPFSLGDRVDWTAIDRSDEGGWLDEVLGSERARAAVFQETHHGQFEGETVRLGGRVERIRAVIRENASTVEDPVLFTPVPGTLELRDLETVDRESGEASPMTLLDGSLVPPPRPEDLVPLAPVRAGETGVFVAARRAPRMPRRHRATEGYLVDLADIVVDEA